VVLCAECAEELGIVVDRQLVVEPGFEDAVTELERPAEPPEQP